MVSILDVVRSRVYIKPIVAFFHVSKKIKYLGIVFETVIAIQAASTT